MQAGMDDYITKPIRIVDLRAAIERWGKEAAHPTAERVDRRSPDS